jgi:hypothetical protein
MHADLMLHVPLSDSIDAASAGGRSGATADGPAPTFEDDGVRTGARFGRDCCVRYAVEGNFRREAGTVMLWLKPDWPAVFEDTNGRILWDLRIEHGSVVPNDPSQRWALVYPSPAGKGVGHRPADTFDRWRFCVATNRNRYVIGTDEKRQDKRTRQAVFGQPQAFAAGTWMHLAVTWTNERGAIYVDGRLDADEPLPEGLPDKPLPEAMQLGARESWMNAGVCGVLADFRIYGAALTESAVRAEAGLS